MDTAWSHSSNNSTSIVTMEEIFDSDFLCTFPEITLVWATITKHSWATVHLESLVMLPVLFEISFY
jgi:hypothetical protein